MIISPRVAIEKGYIEFPWHITDQTPHIQQGGIDITLDHVSQYDGSTFVISPDRTVHRDTIKMEPQSFDSSDDNQYFELMPRTSYDVLSDFKISVPEGLSALVIVRSSLNRNGMFVTTGLYDSGFNGNIGGAIHNNSNGISYIVPGTRFAQVLFVSTDNATMYAGQYQDTYQPERTTTGDN